MQKKGNKYGTHRVIEPKGVLPQPANKIDNNMDEIYDNEILIDVQTLNIDSASFTQIEQQAGGDKAKIAEIMMDIVAKQGKHRNPVTGSGGMLLGTVEKIGDALKGKIDLKEGDKIATLVSLSLTPLRIADIKIFALCLIQLKHFNCIFRISWVDFLHIWIFFKHNIKILFPNVLYFSPKRHRNFIFCCRYCHILLLH